MACIRDDYEYSYYIPLFAVTIYEKNIARPLISPITVDRYHIPNII